MSDELDTMIAKVRALGAAPEEVAKLAAPLVEAAVKQTAAAGTSPDGVAWAPRRDGRPALVNAAAAVAARAIGPVVQLRLVGTPTGSQTAQAIQNHYRPILPSKASELPKPVTAALTEAGRRYFNRSMGR